MNYAPQYESKYKEYDDESLKEIIVEEEIITEETIVQPFSPSDISLSNPPMNLGDLIDMMKEGWIKYDPEYQRAQNLWSKEKQSRLIESVLLGLRLPAFYFEEISKTQWTIIDGLQRCCAIRNFCVTESMTLTDLEFLGKQFENKKFSELDFSTRRSIRMLPITVNLLAKGVPSAVKYILFKRLNTGGLPLTDQEIRNAVYAGPVIKCISDMAQSKHFKQATQNKILTERKADMDFVARFVAFYTLGWKNYQPNLDTFINLSMEKLNKENDSNFFIKMKENFQNAMILSIQIFGDRAFRKQQSIEDRRRPLNKAYFEVISVSLALLTAEKQKKLLDNKDLFISNLNTAMRESSSYRNSFSSGTGLQSSVFMRYQWMETIINATLHGKKTVINNDNQSIIAQLQVAQ